MALIPIVFVLVLLVVLLVVCVVLLIGQRAAKKGRPEVWNRAKIAAPLLFLAFVVFVWVQFR